MTAPGDGPEESSPEEALRRALSDAVSGVEPSADGLDRIRARIGRRRPRPWLVAVLAGAAERVRHWTWRGHWAWPESLSWSGQPAARRKRRPRHRKGRPGAEAARLTRRFPGLGPLARLGPGRLWPAAALAGVVLLAGVALSVQPFRQAIGQGNAIPAPDGGARPGGAGTGGAGTEGKGTPADDGSTEPALDATPGATRPSQPGASGAASQSGGVLPAATSGACRTGASPSLVNGQATQTPAGKQTPSAGEPGASSSAPASRVRGTRAPTPAFSTLTPSVSRGSPRPAATCPVSPASLPAVPSVSTSNAAQTGTGAVLLPSDTPPATTSAPSGTAAPATVATATPTPAPTSSGTAPAASTEAADSAQTGASGPPSGS